MAAFGTLGNFNEARGDYERLNDLLPGVTIADTLLGIPFAIASDRIHLGWISCNWFVRILARCNKLKFDHIYYHGQGIPMNLLISALALGTTLMLLLANAVFAASDTHGAVSDDVVAEQRHILAKNTMDTDFSPQSPRDIDAAEGHNARVFEAAPAHTQMNLCNIHFHENAEHKGGEFTTYAGNGDGHGYGTGFKYSGELSDAELAHYDKAVGASDHGDLQPGDTIEVHYLHTTATVVPGPTLGSCLSEAIGNPQLRVETRSMCWSTTTARAISSS